MSHLLAVCEDILLVYRSIANHLLLQNIACLSSNYAIMSGLNVGKFVQMLLKLFKHIIIIMNLSVNY